MWLLPWSVHWLDWKIGLTVMEALEMISNWDPKGKNTPLVLSVISSLIANHILLSPPQFGVWWKREAEDGCAIAVLIWLNLVIDRWIVLQRHGD